jgi:hypothetical protein
MRRFPSQVLPMFVFAACILMIACGSGSNNNGGGGGGGNQIAVVISSQSGATSVNVTKTLSFTATVTGTTNTAVNWQVNLVPGGAAASGTIGTSGVYTAPATAPSGTVSITAVSQADTSVTSNAILITVSAPPPPIVVTIAAANNAASVVVSQTLQFSSTVTGTTNTGVTWYVSSVENGNSTVGTIDSTGLYTAPATPPAPTGDVIITAVSQASANVTSNAITIAVVNPAGLTISPLNPTVPAGATQPFAAAFNGAPVSASWAISSAGGAPNIGTIDQSGNYQAPLAPPLGQLVVVTASEGGNQVSTLARIVFSGASFNGQYTFSFDGTDSTGNVLDAAGVLVANGVASSTAGTITTGVVDINSGSNGVTTACPLTGTFSIGAADGRSSATITCKPASSAAITFTLQFTLTSNTHGLLIDFDSADTGSGSIDLQNTNVLSIGLISGNYAFGAAGVDLTKSGALINVAGVFIATPPSSGGTVGTIDASTTAGGTEDVVDSGLSPALTKDDQGLVGSYQLDSANAQYGRGTITMTSPTAGNPLASVTFAFYMIDQTHFKIVEIDTLQDFILAGEVYSSPAPKGKTFSDVFLKGSYVFFVSGNSMSGSFSPYTLGGVWVLNGQSNGEIISGEDDFDDNGTATTGANSLVTSTYIVSPPNGTLCRFEFNTKDSQARQSEYTVYPTSNGSAFVIEIDFDKSPQGSAGTGIAASGFAWQQAAEPASPSAGAFAVGFTGAVLSSHSDQATGGELLVTTGTTTVAGTLDINSPAGAGSPQSSAITPASTILSADSFGRGPANLATVGGATFNLVYYSIDANRALLIDIDSGRVGAGIIERQF